MATEEHSRAGGRAYSVRVVSMAGYLFRFIHQSNTAIPVHETRSRLYNWQHFTCQKLSNGLEEQLIALTPRSSRHLNRILCGTSTANLLALK